MVTRMREIAGSARVRVAQAGDAQAVEDLRIALLGKKSELSGLLRLMGGLPAEQRPEAGKAANEAKQEISDALEARRSAFAADERRRRLAQETLDVTLPGRPVPMGRRHPLTQTCDEIIAIFTELGFEVASGPDLEDEFHNFEALNIPANHPARDMQDTFYLAEGGVLRTHTSPVQIRSMQSRRPPLAVIAPGRVYRCDADLTHSPMFTQIEGLMVDEDVRMSDLKGILERLIHRYFGEDRPYRLRPSFFPFTEPSAEVDILWHKDSGEDVWLEVLGAGMVHPAVLENVGYDSQRLSGFAFGLGVERFAMLKYGIPNIRLFYENDLRFLRQF
ncbi:MAG: phenylalanine--tRNA ligase subunit alpha [bacterium]|nr:phenylalanine--tRNA ligase subunit alpha [bacterium]